MLICKKKKNEKQEKLEKSVIVMGCMLWGVSWKNIGDN